jgi:hypothetical protein
MSLGLVLLLTHFTVQTQVSKIACCLEMPLSYGEIECRKIQQIETIQASRKLTKTDASQAERFIQVESYSQAGLEGNPQKLQLSPSQVGSLSIMHHGLRRL